MSVYGSSPRLRRTIELEITPTSGDSSRGLRYYTPTDSAKRRIPKLRDYTRNMLTVPQKEITMSERIFKNRRKRKTCRRFYQDKLENPNMYRKLKECSKRLNFDNLETDGILETGEEAKEFIYLVSPIPQIRIDTHIILSPKH